MTWTPGMAQSVAETARIVGFCPIRDSQICCISSDESSLSKSITMRSVLPSANRLATLEGVKQTFVRIEKSCSMRSMVQNTAGSWESNKHSNAISGVIFRFSEGGLRDQGCRARYRRPIRFVRPTFSPRPESETFDQSGQLPSPFRPCQRWQQHIYQADARCL